jgi:hypothetical protein
MTACPLERDQRDGAVERRGALSARRAVPDDVDGSEHRYVDSVAW